MTIRAQRLSTHEMGELTYLDRKATIFFADHAPHGVVLPRADVALRMGACSAVPRSRDLHANQHLTSTRAPRSA